MTRCMASSGPPVPGAVRRQDRVVDESYPADAGGDRQERLLVDRLHGGEGLRVDEREVLGLDVEVGEGRAGRAGHGGGVAAAGGDGLLGGGEGPAQRERAPAVLGAEAHVAAGEREAVGL